MQAGAKPGEIEGTAPVGEGEDGIELESHDELIDCKDSLLEGILSVQVELGFID